MSEKQDRECVEVLTSNLKGWMKMEPLVEVRRGSTGNVIAGLASFFFPGLGQLVQGRLLSALFFFVLSCALWFVLLGWIAHIWSAISAALYEG